MGDTGAQGGKSACGYRVGSMFAGIGGICSAFRQSGCNVVWANEIDTHACMTYRKFIKDNRLVEGDIVYSKNSIPRIDILTAGFPCQPFSVAGHKGGFDDPRGKLFFEIIDVMKSKKPKAVLLENVANIARHDDGKTMETIRSAIRSAGYECEPMLMNTKDYGNVPQHRYRAYIVAFRNKKAMESYVFPKKIPLEKNIRDIINGSEKKDDMYYYSFKNAKHFNMFESAVTRRDTIYQWRRVYMRENKNGLCPTLTANMGSGGHNVPIVLDDYGIRKLTPEECLAFQGFPKGLKFPEISMSQKYKQVGNSVSVPVVKRIADSIISVMQDFGL